MEEKLPVKWTGHASRELLIAGGDAAAVKKQFGSPTAIQKTNFSRPASRSARLPASIDELWTYPYTTIGQRLIYFSRGRVVLAIEEWSDF